MNSYYTHWAYFEKEAEVRACMAELKGLYRLRLDGPDEEIERDEWLLRVGQIFGDGEKDWRSKIQEPVERHGGIYDGGEYAFGPTVNGRLVNIPDPAMADAEPSDEEKAKLEQLRVQVGQLDEAQVARLLKELEEGP